MDNILAIITIIGFGVSSLATFLSIFFIAQEKNKGDGYIFLYFSLLILGLELFYTTLIHSQFIMSFPWLYIPGRLNNLLIYPIFTLFIWSVSKPDFNLKRVHKVLLALFVLYALYVFVLNQFISATEKLSLLTLFYEDRRPGPYNYWSNPSTLIKSALIPMAFMSLIVYEFVKFSNNVVNHQSQRLFRLLGAIISIIFVYKQASNFLYKWAYQKTGYSMIEWPIDILFLGLIVILLCTLALMVNTGSTFFPPSKYLSSALQAMDYQKIIDRATKEIESNELYKEDQFNLNELSKRLRINPKYLSQAINDDLGVNFRDFLNSYRVEEAKKQLLNKENETLTLEAIGELSGFNSKSAFFRAFKKATNQTPHQFVKSKKGINS